MYIETVLQALAILVVGMALVFLALGLIVVAMMLMGRFLRPGDRAEAEVPGPRTDERARVAAIAVAIMLAQERDGPQPGTVWQAAIEDGAPSAWQISHRTQALGRRRS